MWLIRSVIAPWDSVIAATSAAEPVASASPMWKQHVGLPVGGEVVEARRHHGDELVEPLDRLRLGALGGQHGDAELDREPHVAAVAPVGEHRRRSAGR